MLCPNCGQTLIRDMRDMPYSYKGQRVLIPAVTGEYCPQCTEVVLDPDTAQRVSEQMLTFNTIFER